MALSFVPVGSTAQAQAPAVAPFDAAAAFNNALRSIPSAGNGIILNIAPTQFGNTKYAPALFGSLPQLQKDFSQRARELSGILENGTWPNGTGEDDQPISGGGVQADQENKDYEDPRFFGLNGALDDIFGEAFTQRIAFFFLGLGMITVGVVWLAAPTASGALTELLKLRTYNALGRGGKVRRVIDGDAPEALPPPVEPPPIDDERPPSNFFESAGETIEGEITAPEPLPELEQPIFKGSRNRSKRGGSEPEKGRQAKDIFRDAREKQKANENKAWGSDFYGSDPEQFKFPDNRDVPLANIPPMPKEKQLKAPKVDPFPGMRPEPPRRAGPLPPNKKD